jgi:hypothetical protein
VHECPQCQERVEVTFRFCPWCAAPLRRKIVEFFPAALEVPGDHGKALRVSRYVEERHVRFSIWSESGVVEGAVSISDEEAARLGRFVRDDADTLELPVAVRRLGRRR